MASTLKKIKELSKQDQADARKGGFRRKKPKKPAQSKLKTATQYNNYVDRYNDWADAAREKAKDYRSSQSEKDKVKKAVKTHLSKI